MTTLSMADYLVDDTITLSGIPSTKHPASRGGGSYPIPSLSGRDGMLLSKITRLSDMQTKPDADETPAQRRTRRKRAADLDTAMREFCRDDRGKEISFEAKVLGASLDQMIEDGVSQVRVGKVLRVAIVAARDGVDYAAQLLRGVVVAEAGA